MCIIRFKLVTSFKSLPGLRKPSNYLLPHLDFLAGKPRVQVSDHKLSKR
jgi:hypothetical protein